MHVSADDCRRPRALHPPSAQHQTHISIARQVHGEIDTNSYTSLPMVFSKNSMPLLMPYKPETKPRSEPQNRLLLIGDLELPPPPPKKKKKTPSFPDHCACSRACHRPPGMSGRYMGTRLESCSLPSLALFQDSYGLYTATPTLTSSSALQLHNVNYSSIKHAWLLLASPMHPEIKCLLAVTRAP